MSNERININIQSLDEKNSKYGNGERLSSRTDKIVEASFTSDVSQRIEYPLASFPDPKDMIKFRSRNFSEADPDHFLDSRSNTIKSFQSFDKLKDILAKTSEKLNVYTRKQDSSNIYAEILEKNKEIVELKRKVRKLEIEKKEALESNKKLLEASRSIRNPVLDSDVQVIKITKYSAIFLSKIKENPKWARAFFNIINSEADFFMQIKSENFKMPLLQLLEFLCEFFDASLGYIPSPSNNISFGSKEQDKINDLKSGKRSYSSMADNDYTRLIEESDVISKTIASQKEKIANICEKVKQSMNKSNYMTPINSRPSSSTMRYSRPYSTSPNIFNSIAEEKEDDKHT